MLPTVEGERAIVVELQALVSQLPGGELQTHGAWSRARQDRPAAGGAGTEMLESARQIRRLSARSQAECGSSEPAGDLPMALAMLSAAARNPGPVGPVSFWRSGSLGRGPASPAFTAQAHRSPSARVPPRPRPDIHARLPAGYGADQGGLGCCSRQAGRARTVAATPRYPARKPGRKLALTASMGGAAEPEPGHGGFSRHGGAGDSTA